MQDLWADFADETRTGEEEARRGNARQRRLSEQGVLAALRAWLLEEYLLPYATSLGATRIFKHCYWIDGLGNNRVPTVLTTLPAQNGAQPVGKRGKQRSSTQAVPLPPALQPVTATARALACLERPIALHGFVLDERRGRRKERAGPPGESGAETSGPLTLPKEGGTLPACWSELAPVLLSALEQSAAVFLLNPLKDGLFRYADLAPLYARAAPTELFLWLPHKQIETRLLPARRTSEGAAALTNLLRGDRWKTRLAKSEENPRLAISELVGLLAESMRPHFLTVQQLSFPVRTGPALVEAAPYSLIFATRRQDSLASLNDALCLRERRLVAESQQGVLNEEWFAAQREEHSAALLEALSRQILALGRAQRVRRWPDLRQQLLLAHFGQYTQQDYNQLLLELLARGDVLCEWRKRAPEAGEAAIPGNEDLLHWP